MAPDSFFAYNGDLSSLTTDRPYCTLYLAKKISSIRNDLYQKNNTFLNNARTDRKIIIHKCIFPYE